MTPQAQFLLLVQTGAICYTLTQRRPPATAVAVLAYALTIPADRLPADLEDAAAGFLALQYASTPPDPPVPVPAWLIGFDPY